MKKFKNYFWLAIEGTDGVGKTSLIREIEKYLARQKRINFVIIKEFSNSRLGTLIKNIIKKKRFFSLGDNVQFPFSETLLLAADFVYQFEKALLKCSSSRKKLFIVSDRGIHSFLTYQVLRITSQYQAMSNINIETWINKIFKPINKPHFVILLISPIDQIQKRIIKREGSINTKELQFIEKVQEEFLKILKNNPSVMIIENQNGKFKYVKQKAIEKIKEILKNSLAKKRLGVKKA